MVIFSKKKYYQLIDKFDYDHFQNFVQYDQLTPEYNNPAALLPNTQNEDDNKEVKNYEGMWTNCSGNIQDLTKVLINFQKQNTAYLKI